MRIESLQIDGFRNIDSLVFTPGQTANIIYGDNAQGKTNVLEAVWLFSGARSFRGAKDREYIPFGREIASLTMHFYAGGRSQSASLAFDGRKKVIRLNEIKKDSVSALAGVFCAVVFSPDHLSLVKEGPEKRRRMIDASLCQTSPKYGKVLENYERVVRQRNRLLKDIPHHPGLVDTLDTWDLKLLEYGAYISRMRARYIARLAEIAAEIYNGISLGKEEFSAVYLPSFGKPVPALEKQAFRERMEQAIAASRDEDIRSGSTSVGPHRDDLEICVDGMSARAFGSQGQQRSCVLALKLAECRILEERWGEPPVILLDDVMSELDENRRSYLLNQLGGRQVLMTCCDVSAFTDMENGSVFHIRSGKLYGSAEE